MLSTLISSIIMFLCLAHLLNKQIYIFTIQISPSALSFPLFLSFAGRQKARACRKMKGVLAITMWPFYAHNPYR